jgi:hypothetical protein
VPTGAGLDALSRDLHRLLGATVRDETAGGGTAALVRLAITHARDAIRDRRSEIGPGEASPCHEGGRIGAGPPKGTRAESGP